MAWGVPKSARVLSDLLEVVVVNVMVFDSSQAQALPSPQLMSRSSNSLFPGNPFLRAGHRTLDGRGLRQCATWTASVLPLFQFPVSRLPGCDRFIDASRAWRRATVLPIRCVGVGLFCAREHQH